MNSRAQVRVAIAGCINQRLETDSGGKFDVARASVINVFDLHITLGVMANRVSTSMVVLTLAAIAMPLAWFGRNGVPLPKAFRSRSCQGAGWRHAFPAAPKEEIRTFLSVFVAAFAFHQRQRLKFNPSDTILGIYRSMYPHKWQPDGLELETLEASLAKEYGIRLSEMWRESLTLGELFARVTGVSRSHP